MEAPYNHCDDYIHDFDMPLCLRQFLLLQRLPGADQLVLQEIKGLPWRIYADYGSARVVLTMASRMGDVGINTDLKAQAYKYRVFVSQLSNFSYEA